jgi:putative addiction module component (TIGR02574 family)
MDTDAVGTDSDNLPLTEAQRREIDRRLDRYETNPPRLSSWAEVRARLGATGSSDMTAKEALHRLIDELPDDQAERLLHGIVDPVLLARASAPVDDEPETPEEAAAVTEGLADLARGDVLTTEQLRRELGI